MKLPLEKYSGDADAVVGSWVLLEGDTIEEGGDPTIAEQGRGPATRSSGEDTHVLVTLVDH